MKILVIGGGSIGQRYAAYAATLAEAALMDIDPAKLGQFRGTVFSDIGGALNWKPDGAIVATPHTTHVPLAEKIVRHGIPVLIEKPISHDADEARGFLRRLRAAGAKAYTVSNMRFHPAVKTLRDHIGAIAPVFFARAHFGNWLPNMRPGADYRTLYCARKDRGGGMILDGIHEIDYLLWLLGPCVSVTAAAAKRSDLDIDVEDYASLALGHRSGVPSEIHLDYLQQCRRRGCEIAGRGGTLVWESEGKSPERCAVRLYTPAEGWRDLLRGDLDMAQTYRDMIDSFIHAIRNPAAKNVLATAEEGYAALKVADAAYKSARRRRQVKIEP